MAPCTPSNTTTSEERPETSPGRRVTSPRVRWGLAVGLLLSMGFAVWQVGIFIARHGSPATPRLGPWRSGAVAPPSTQPSASKRSPAELLDRSLSGLQPTNVLPPLAPPEQTELSLAVERPAREAGMVERQWMYRTGLPGGSLAEHYRHGLVAAGWRYLGARRSEGNVQCLVFSRPSAVATVRIRDVSGQSGKNRLVLHVTQPQPPATIPPRFRDE